MSERIEVCGIIMFHLRSTADTSQAYPHPIKDDRRAMANTLRGIYGILLCLPYHLRLTSSRQMLCDRTKRDSRADPSLMVRRLGIVFQHVFPPTPVKSSW